MPKYSSVRIQTDNEENESEQSVERYYSINYASLNRDSAGETVSESTTRPVQRPPARIRSFEDLASSCPEDCESASIPLKYLISTMSEYSDLTDEQPRQIPISEFVGARVEPTGSENILTNLIIAAGPSVLDDEVEDCVSNEEGSILGTRGFVEGSDLSWDLVRPPLIGQSEDNVANRLNVTVDDSVTSNGSNEVSEEEEKSEKSTVTLDNQRELNSPHWALRGENPQKGGNDRGKFLVLVNKELLQISSPDEAECDHFVGPGELGPSSPSVVSASSLASSRLEWDSGADVGYGGPRVMYGLSTLERMAIGSYASVLRMEPEGTSSMCRDKGPLRNQGLIARDDPVREGTDSEVSSGDTNDEVERIQREILAEDPETPNKLDEGFKLKLHRSLPNIQKKEPARRDGKSRSLMDLNAKRDFTARSSSDSNCTITGNLDSKPFCSTAVEKLPGFSLRGPCYNTPELGTDVKRPQVTPGTPVNLGLDAAKGNCDFPMERMKGHVAGFIEEMFGALSLERRVKIRDGLLRMIAQNGELLSEKVKEGASEPDKDSNISPSSEILTISKQGNSSDKIEDSTETDDTESSSLKTTGSKNLKLAQTNETLTSSFEFRRTGNGLTRALRPNIHSGRHADPLQQDAGASRGNSSTSDKSSAARRKSAKRRSSRKMSRDSTEVTSTSQTSSKDTVNSGTSSRGPGDVEVLKGLIQKQRHKHIRRLEQEVQWLEKIEKILTVNAGGFLNLRRVVGGRETRARLRKETEEFKDFGQTYPSPVPLGPKVTSIGVQTAKVVADLPVERSAEGSDRRPVVSVPFGRKVLKEKTCTGSRVGGTVKVKSGKEGSVAWFLSLDPKERTRESEGMSLQEAFARNKVDVMRRVEERRVMMERNSRRREQRPKLTYEEAVRVLATRNMRVYTKPLRISEQHHQPQQRKFSHRELREQTEKLYRDLAEVVNREELRRREEMLRSNRLMANVFKKRLLENVLNGKVSMAYNQKCL